MTEILTFVMTWLAGGILGAVYFGGLYWTVQKGMSAKQPAFLFLGSLILRMSIVLTGFYFVSGQHWERLLLCLLGFVMARVVVMSLTRTSKETPPPTPKEGNHAA